jgi:hypothetical protein
MTKLFKLATFALLAIVAFGSSALYAQTSDEVTTRIFDGGIGPFRPGTPIVIQASTVAPVISTIAPVTGTRGATVSVTLSGTDFESGMVLDAGDGITATNMTVSGTTSLTTNFVIASTASLGQHNVTLTSSGGVSVPKVFTVVAQTPTFTGITPASGMIGANVNVTLTGTNFVPGLTLNPGSDITVHNLSVVSATSATATLTIASTAALGAREITVTNSGGTSGALTFTVLAAPAPTLTGISPLSGVRSSSVSVTLSGTNFISGLAVDTIDGITVSTVSVVNSTTATALFVIAADAVLGPRAIRVTTAGGSSGTTTFTVAAVGPTLTGISPASSIPGATFTANLTGTNFVAGMTVDASAGITVTTVNVTSSTVATAVFAIAADAALGTRNVTVTTTSGTSAPFTFTVIPPVPTLSLISPASGILGSAVLVSLTGTNFYAPMTISVGTDITVSNINVVDTSTATATFTIGLNAFPGKQNVTIATTGGSSSAAVFSVTPFPPTLTSLSPSSAVQGNLARSFTVTITGTNLYEPSIAISGTGVSTPENFFVTSATSGTTTFTIDANAALGPRNVTVSNAGGTSAPLAFTIVAAAPTLTSITPAIGVRGTSVPVTIAGTNFAQGTTLNSIAGVTVSNLTVVNEVTLTATLAIDANATLGTRNVTATTSLGTTNALTFTIADQFPDLSITSSHTGKFGVGFNETYTVTVANVGTKTTTGTLTVKDTLPPGLTFVSGVGTGWTCSAAGQTVTCTNPATLAASASSSYTLTVAVGSTAAANVNHTVSLTAAAGDLNTANDTAVDPTIVAPIPSPSFTFAPAPLQAGEQASVTVKLGSTFPHDITGTISLSFTSNAVIPLDDPAIQFASGGRTATYTIAANTTQARFNAATDTTPLGFQPGTVSGRLNFAGTFATGTLQGTFAPTVGVNSPTVAQAAPVIKSIETSTQGGFAASITLLSTIREVTEVSLLFDTNPKVKPSCGNLTGCSVNDQEITFNTTALFTAWYTADKTYGSLNTLRIPLNISGGSTKGKVNVILKNRQGFSNIMSFNLP